MNISGEIIGRVSTSISRYGMVHPGDRVIVAVSGGPDSVCLLHVLHHLSHDLEIKLAVAHYDHGFRHAEDEAETRFVEGLAETLGLPWVTEKATSLKGWGRASLEERAREARYAFLERIKDRFHAQRIAVGHTLNDQAETVLMRLLRGSGPLGLAGIPLIRDNIIRPLMEIKRSEVLACLKDLGLSYMQDSSNADTRHLRNRIREELLPLLITYQPRLLEHLGQLSSILRDDNRFLETEAMTWVGDHAFSNDDHHMTIRLDAFILLPPALRQRVIRHILEKVGDNLRRIHYGHIQSIDRMAVGKRPQASLVLPRGIMVQRVYDQMAFMLGTKGRNQDFEFIIEGPGTFHLQDERGTLSILETSAEDVVFDQGPRVAHVDAEKIRFPIVVRNFRAGDWFIPLGMSGHRKVKNLFIDLKIPHERRRSVPILFSGDKLVWICGIRMDDRFKIAPGTKRIYEITLTPSPRRCA